MFLKKTNKNLDIFETTTPIFENLSDAVVFYDKNFKIKRFNKSFKNLVNLSDNELKNLEITTRMINDKKHYKIAEIFFPSLITKNIKIKKTELAEISDIEISEPSFFCFRSATLKLSERDIEYFVKIITDKTELIKKEKESTEFLQMAAHHIRTPLSEIKWALETIKTTEIGDNFETINSTLKIINNTILLSEGILLSSQIETGKVKILEEENNISEVVKNLLQLFEETIKEKKISVNIDIDLSAVKSKFDKRILSVILYAILENAVLYNKESGSIDIKAEKLKDKPFIQILIADTGFGIPENEKGKVFEKYFRGKKSAEIKPKGFGLGIYLSKKLTEFLGGNIELSSKFGEGTNVFIRIPIK